MTFTLEIELGNAAMQNPWDVARALEKVAEGLRELTSADLERHLADGRIRDENGNTVGRWAFTGEEET